MRLYCQEADRQVRVYGLSSATASLTPVNTPAASQSQSQQSQVPSPERQPRGLAAIPLLCAAASESRQAYLRRLSQTALRQAWWKRQEPLTATPGTFWALPEHALLGIASLLEHVSLRVQEENWAIPAGVVQSLLWPLHNSLLALWMGYILVATAWVAAIELIQTVLFGSRRTGLTLESVWKDQVQFVSQSVHVVTDAHQPVSARLVGLLLLPLTTLISVVGLLTTTTTTSATASNAEEADASNSMMLLGTSLLYSGALASTWWYWFAVLPFLMGIWLSVAFVAGQCFALIELAGV